MSTLLLIGCSAQVHPSEDMVLDWKPVSRFDSTAHGTWEMEGYGRLVDITPDTHVVYHVVDDFCIEDTGLVPFFSLYAMQEERARLSLLYYDFGEQSEALQTRIDLERLPGIPEACTSNTYADATPGEVFEILWSAFEQHYAFFEERNVDWLEQKSIFDTRTDSVESVDELFNVLSDLLGALRDGHVNLYHGTDKAFNAGVRGLALRNRIVDKWREEGEPGPEGSFVSSWHQQVHGSVYEILAPGSLRKGAAGALEWGLINGDVGYVRINRFSGLAGQGVLRPAQLDTLHAAMQQMRADIDATRSVIVDVSLNGGGMDPAAITAASYFADQPRHVLTKEIRGGHDTKVMLSPPEGFSFAKPVYVLTTEVTASAAEVFVLMMRTFPHVTHVGEKTRGGISGMLPKRLPQDFMVTISNEKVLDVEGVLYEGQGIPPEQPMSVFPSDSLYTGLAHAIVQLSER